MKRKHPELVILLCCLSISSLGCSNDEHEDSVDAPGLAATDSDAVSQAVNKSVDCDTFVSELRHACADSYQNGLLFDCPSYVTKANTAMRQLHDSTVSSDVKAKTAAKMCERVGKHLREELAQADHKSAGDACVVIGKHLDTQCFDRIGEANYNNRCSGWLIATKDLSNPACAAQLVQF